MSISGISGNIATTSLNYTNGASMSQVGVAMLGKSLDSMESAGNGLMKMLDSAASVQEMERSVNPHIGGNFDMSV